MWLRYAKLSKTICQKFCLPLCAALVNLESIYLWRRWTKIRKTALLNREHPIYVGDVPTLSEKGLMRNTIINSLFSSYQVMRNTIPKLKRYHFFHHTRKRQKRCRNGPKYLRMDTVLNCWNNEYGHFGLVAILKFSILKTTKNDLIYFL